MTELDVDSAVIEEFRANLGQVGGPLAGVPVLLLHHTGARTGERRVTPPVYRPEARRSWCSHRTTAPRSIPRGSTTSEPGPTLPSR
jgi:hypothetical protein